MTLSARGRALFDAGRRSLQPRAEDRRRIFAALSARIDGSGPRHAAAARGSVHAAGLGWQGIAAIVAGLAAAGAAAWMLLHAQARGPVPAAASSAPVASVPSTPAFVPAPPEAPATSATGAPVDAPGAPRAGSRPSVAAAPVDRLSEEVALLSQAERDLHDGQYRAALGLLDEHRRKFPNGTLTQERMAARVQAWCGLGRVSDAEAELARLTRLSPKSPHGARTGACPVDR